MAASGGYGVWGVMAGRGGARKGSGGGYGARKFMGGILYVRGLRKGCGCLMGLWGDVIGQLGRDYGMAVEGICGECGENKVGC